MPVPPPTIAIGVWPNRCSRASPITVSSEPTCRLDAVGSKPMYAVTALRRERSATPSVASYTSPRHVSSSNRFAIANAIHYIVDVERRRARLL